MEDRRELLDRWRAARRSAREAPQAQNQTQARAAVQAPAPSVSTQNPRRRESAGPARRVERRRRSDGPSESGSVSTSESEAAKPAQAVGFKSPPALVPPARSSTDSARSSGREEALATPAVYKKPDAAPVSGATERSRDGSSSAGKDAEKARKKRRTSFLSPSAGMSSLSGGAQRILTPMRAARVSNQLEGDAHDGISDEDGDDDEDEDSFGWLDAPLRVPDGVSPLRDARASSDDTEDYATTLSLDATRSSSLLGFASPAANADDADRRHEAELDGNDEEKNAEHPPTERKTLTFGSVQHLGGALRVPQGAASASKGKLEKVDEETSRGFARLHPKKRQSYAGEQRVSRVQVRSRHSTSGASLSPPPSIVSSFPQRVAVRVEATKSSTTMAPVSTSKDFIQLTAASAELKRRSLDVKRKSLDSTRPTKSVEERLKENLKWELDDFVVTKNLGQGKFGNVYLARERCSNVTVALKVLFKASLIRECGTLNLKREIEIQVRLHHPNILRLFGYFFDESCIYLVLEYAPHGELFKELSKQKFLDEALAAHYVAQVVEALKYCHSRHVIHRDLKPENLLLGANHTIKLADFGWAVHAPKPRDKRLTFCGTPDYLSPEMLQEKPYDHCTDAWSLGVLAYELVVGATPFYHENQMEMYKRIEQVSYTFPRECGVSASARSFIAGLLRARPESRMSLERAAEHEWLKNRAPIR